MDYPVENVNDKIRASGNKAVSVHEGTKRNEWSPAGDGRKVTPRRDKYRALRPRHCVSGRRSYVKQASWRIVSPSAVACAGSYRYIILYMHIHANPIIISTSQGWTLYMILYRVLSPLFPHGFRCIELSLCMNAYYSCQLADPRAGQAHG